MCESFEVCVTKAIVLHGQLFEVSVEVEHIADGGEGFARQMIPGDVEELQIFARRRVKHILAHFIGHLAVI